MREIKYFWSLKKEKGENDKNSDLGIRKIASNKRKRNKIVTDNKLISYWTGHFSFENWNFQIHY